MIRWMFRSNLRRNGRKPLDERPYERASAERGVACRETYINEIKRFKRSGSMLLLRWFYTIVLSIDLAANRMPSRPRRIVPATCRDRSRRYLRRTVTYDAAMKRLGAQLSWRLPKSPSSNFKTLSCTLKPPREKRRSPPPHPEKQTNCIDFEKRQLEHTHTHPLGGSMRVE